MKLAMLLFIVVGFHRSHSRLIITYNTFWHRLNVVQAESFKKVMSKAISHLSKEVQNAKALIDGVLVNYYSLAFILVGEVQKI
jgi:hypothetical protein